MSGLRNVGKSGRSGQKGLTLIELLIALVLTAIIGGALYQGLINQSRSFVQQDQVAEAQQNCRVAMDNMLRELRMAGYSMAYQTTAGFTSLTTVSDQGIALGTSVTTINGTTVQTNNASSRNYTDALVIRRGDSVPWTVWKYKVQHLGRWTKVMFDEKINVREGDPDYVFMISPDKTEFWSAIVTNRGVDDEYANKKMIWIEDYTRSIASTNGKTTDYGGGTVVKLKEIAFYIDTSGSFPKLMKAVNGGASQVVANHIEDLQVAFQTSDGSWYHNVGGTGDPTINDIRNVRVSVVARSRVAGSKAIYYEAALEDGRRHPTSGSDGYPRRVMTSQIRARNFGVD
ncbi:MAG: prepilin-type N-terminal cleavage/methylation domain-containing protein [Desulfobacterales bacterium]|nr:prepilin-type N-terminal cleavage/methylation domain-containing protein [Desulfobacterales bacterium]